MFRRLFAIETAALQLQNEAPPCDASPVQSAASGGEQARFAAMPSCYGMWSTRAAI